MNIVGKLLGSGGNPLKDLNANNIGAGFVSALLCITGPPALMLAAAANGNFTTEQTILWLFAVNVFGGIFSIVLPLYYRMPIVGGHSITGVAFLATVTTQFSFHELIGAYMFSGILLLLVGYFGIFSKLMSYVPREIIAAMLAGMITKYMVNFIVSIRDLYVVGGIALLVYFICGKYSRRIPPMVAAVFTAFILLYLTQDLGRIGIFVDFIPPSIQVPDFNSLTFLSVSVPLALLILSNDAAVGIGAIEQNEYRPPVNRIVTFSGLFSICASFFGGQSSNIAGMMSAVCSDRGAGPKDKRYMGAVVSGILIILFGVFSWKLVPFIQSLPSSFVAILVGFSLIGVFGNSLHTSFSKPTLKMSAAFTYIISISGITILSIGAPVWALLAGTIIARFVDNNKLLSSNKRSANVKRKVI
ncbi:benzoate/H(+) symporter BenE family transporter [Bacillus sp. Marseille-P3661]|uniref:benzoate/H(+) symporter BenE family transporter n=1 Tax=Bacillus sp. Marseille-P3661 TaxID=1936234 RepID=UPI000C864144|nr:benzoate/H(+) symporter BenE family transporter [Bacillus sp. Marseille-P3661]